MVFAGDGLLDGAGDDRSEEDRFFFIDLEAGESHCLVAR